jgi:hypothetical protein
MKYKAQITLQHFFVFGKGRCRTCLESGEWNSAEEARNYAELLIASGVAIAYRVVFKPEGSETWYNHEFVKYLEDYVVNNTTYIPSHTTIY